MHFDELVDLEIGSAVLTTTEDHPFWNQTDREWQRADKLDRGDLVLGPGGVMQAVGLLRTSSVHVALAYNLTVDGIHTYYVMADETPVLVHNEPRPRPADFIDGPMPQRGQTALYVIWRPGTGEFLKWGIWTNNGKSRYSATSMLNRGERMQIVRNYDAKADALAAERFATSRSPGPDNLKEQLDGKGTWQSWQQTMAELKASTCW